MRRRSVLIAVGLLLALVGTGLVTLALLARHEPGFYTRASVEPGAVRRQQSKAFVAEFVRFLNDLKNQEREWQTTFTETQVNSFFEEDFICSRLADKLLPENV